jgi:hypothetical protein
MKTIFKQKEKPLLDIGKSCFQTLNGHSEPFRVNNSQQQLVAAKLTACNNNNIGGGETSLPARGIVG